MRTEIKAGAGSEVSDLSVTARAGCAYQGCSSKGSVNDVMGRRQRGVVCSDKHRKRDQRRKWDVSMNRKCDTLEELGVVVGRSEE